MIMFLIISILTLICTFVSPVDAQEISAPDTRQIHSDYQGGFSVPERIDWERPFLNHIISFNGTPGTRLKISDKPVYNAKDNITVDFWLRNRQWPSLKGRWWKNKGLRCKTILNKDWGWDCTIMPQGELRFLIFSQAGDDKASTTSNVLVEPGIWHHVICVFSRSAGRIAIYMDGRMVGEKRGNFGAIKNTVGQPLYMGGCSATTFFDGEIAELQIQNSYLSHDAAIRQSSRMPMTSVHLIKNWMQTRKQQLIKSGLSRDTTLVRDIDKMIAEDYSVHRDLAVINWRIEAAMENKTCLRNIITFATQPISTRMVLPWSLLDTTELARELSITTTPGEYEPASLVVHPLRNWKAVQLTPSDLICGEHVIPASAVDIKIVKCHYQAKTAWRHSFFFDHTAKALIPELLINDNELLKVNLKTDENLLRLSFPTGDKYISTTDATRNKHERWSFDLPFSEFPVKDSPVLLPLDLPAHFNQQFFITLKVPENTPSGVYTGYIAFTSPSGVLGKVDLKARILPFKLAAPRTYYDLDKEFTVSMYYLSILDPVSKGNFSVLRRNAETIRIELQNMIEHNITNPMVYQLQPTKYVKQCSEELFAEVLRLHKEAGFSNRPLYLSGPESNLMMRHPMTHNELKALRKKSNHILDWVEKHCGHRDLFFYGIDEATEERLLRQRDAWKVFHETGAKIFVATRDTDILRKNLSDLIDLPIASPLFNVNTANWWHNKGKIIWSYGSPQSGAEDPELHRRGFGLPIYRARYDGVAPFCYTETFGNPWNDFDNRTNRDHNYVYPTVDGVINTLAWEGFREGIDDIRYATTLKQKIAKVKHSGDKHRQATALEAEQYLATLNFPEQSLDTIRTRIIDYIMKLGDKHDI